MGALSKPQKSKILKAVMQAHVAGIRKGAATPRPAAPPMGGTPLPMPQQGPMGMAKGGIAGLRWNKGKACGGKVKKMAAGGCVGGRGDGCAKRGHTKGRMV